MATDGIRYDMRPTKGGSIDAYMQYVLAKRYIISVFSWDQTLYNAREIIFLHRVAK